MSSRKIMRVVMVCHFSNAEVRESIPLDERRLYCFLRRILGMANKGRSYGDIAPWDTSTINYLREREDIELHVISAHSGLKKRVVSYESHGVHYSFVKCDVATMLKRIIPNDSLWRTLNPMVKDVHCLINDIDPDIVVLIGAENAYYSSTILGIKKYPIYILCQTIYNNPERKKYSFVDNINAKTEIAILNENKYFGVYCKKHYDLLLKLVNNKYIFKFGFPSNKKILDPINCEKQFDFVNFALSMSSAKGFIDSIEAIAIIKKHFPSITLNLVGGGSKSQIDHLKDKVDKLNLKDNIFFTSFFEKQQDLFLHIQKSRFSVLPCKIDNISGTMTQSMQLGLPLVVYKTTGTPTFNKDKACVLIAEHSNIEDLASKMLMLLENKELADTLRRNAREYQEIKIQKSKMNGEKLIQNFKSIIDNWQKGTPIPQEELFNTEEDD